MPQLKPSFASEQATPPVHNLATKKTATLGSGLIASFPVKREGVGLPENVPESEAPAPNTGGPVKSGFPLNVGLAVKFRTKAPPLFKFAAALKCCDAVHDWANLSSAHGSCIGWECSQFRSPQKRRSDSSSRSMNLHIQVWNSDSRKTRTPSVTECEQRGWVAPVPRDGPSLHTS